MGISKLERYRGCLLGLAAGDAVGTAVEFRDYRNGVCGEIIGSSPVGFLPQQRLSQAVNLGNDADTTAAIYGQLAGAYYGEENVPLDWRSKLAMRDLIENFAGELFSLAWNR